MPTFHCRYVLIFLFENIVLCQKKDNTQQYYNKSYHLFSYIFVLHRDSLHRSRKLFQRFCFSKTLKIVSAASFSWLYYQLSYMRGERERVTGEECQSRLERERREEAKEKKQMNLQLKEKIPASKSLFQKVHLLHAAAAKLRNGVLRKP